MTPDKFHKKVIDTRQKVWDALNDRDFESARIYIREIQMLDREVESNYDLSKSDPD